MGKLTMKLTRLIKEAHARSTREWSSTNIIRKILFILFLAFWWEIFIYFPFMYWDSGTRWACNLLNDNNVIEVMRVHQVDQKAVQLFENRENAENNCRILSKEINNFTADHVPPKSSTPDTPRQLEELIKAQAIEKLIAQDPLPFHLGSFLHETENYLEMINFTALALLLLVFVPTQPKKGALPPYNTRQITVCGLLYFMIFALPLLAMRYTGVLTTEDGRRGFAFNNWDINHTGFIIGLMQAVIYGFMLAALWFSWYSCSESWQNYLTTGTKKHPLNIRWARTLVDDVSRLFADWQRNSLILAAAFLPWSYFDWEYIQFGNGSDARYVYMALVDHLTWIGTWGMLSLPTIMAFKTWQEYKMSLRFGLLNKDNYKNANRHDTLQLLDKIEPLSHLQVFGASLAATVSFILPIIAIFHR